MRSNKSLRQLLSVAMYALGVSGCGGCPQNMVIIQVSGLLPRITELYVTMKLDGVPDKNSMPVPESGTSAFIVYQQMERFGIEVPDNTQRIELDVKGFDPARDTVRQGQGSLDLTQSRDLSIELVAP